jgi:AraC-like DNA-binding protein
MNVHLQMQESQFGPAVAGGAEAFAALDTLQFENVVDFQKLLQVARFDLTQTGRGPLKGHATILRLGDVRLVREVHRPAAVWMTLFAPQLAVFAVPITWHGEVAYNGETATRSNLFRFSDNSGYFGRNAQGGREVVSVGIPRQAILETVAALRGVGPDEIVIGDGALQLPDGKANDVRLLLSRLMAYATAHPEIVTDPSRVDGIANVVQTALLDAFVGACSNTETAGGRVLNPAAIVRRAEERFMDAPDRKVSLASLCAAAHVSAPTLYKAFDIVCDITPLKYFRLRRLSLARSELLQAPPDRGRVKYAARGVGLTELGRFAAEYRALFGETPSATLHNQSARQPDETGTHV